MLEKKHVTLILVVLIVSILGIRLALLRTLKFSLGLDSVYLQVVDVFNRLDQMPVKQAFNPKIDISIPLDGKYEGFTKKHISSYFNMFAGNLVLHELDYEVFPAYEKSVNPLSFSRVYNSGRCQTKGALGYGWRASWEVKFCVVNEIYSFTTSTQELVSFNFSPKDNKFHSLKNGWMKYRLELVPGTQAFQVSDDMGRKFIFEADESSDKHYRLTKIIHSNSIIYYVEYDDDNNKVVSIKENKTGRATNYEYDLKNNVISMITFPSGLKMNIKYEGSNLIKITNNLNNYSRVYAYQKGIDKHLLSGLGDISIKKSFSYTHKLLDKITDKNLNNLFIVKRDFIFGVCQLINAQESLFTFQNIGDLKLKIQGPLQFFEQIQFDDQGRITKLIDSQSTSVQYTWNNAFCMIQKKNRLKGEEIFDYNSNNKLKSYFDVLGNVTQYIYDESGLKVKKILPNNDVIRYSYKGLILESVVVEGSDLRDSYSYDKSGNVTVVEAANGRNIYFKYNKDGYVIEKKISAEREEKYSWDGQLLKEIKYAGINGNFHLYKSFSYDKTGKLSTIMNANNEKINFDYDDLDQVKLIVYPTGEQNQFKRSRNGLVEEYLDKKGDRFKYFYDKLNRLVQISVNENRNFYIEYNIDSGCEIVPFSRNFSKISYQEDVLFEVKYNKGYLIKEVCMPDGSTMYFEYDQAKNLIATSNKKNHRTSFFYDKNSNLNYIYDDSSKDVFLIKHDVENNLIEFTDESLATYRVSYDKKRNPLAVFKGASLDPLVKWRWHNNKIISIDSIIEHKQFSYNDKDNLISQNNSKTGLMEYEYNKYGMISTKKDQEGRKVIYSYDSTKHVKKKELVSSGISYEITHTVAGALKESRRESTIEDDLYFKNTWAENSELKHITFDRKNLLFIAYTASGKVAKKDFLFTPGRITQVNKYDKKGMLEVISEGGGTDPVHFYYDNLARISRIEYPNNLITIYEYNEKGLVADLTTKNIQGETVFKRSYLYDDLWRVSKVVTERGYIKRKYNNDGFLIYESLDDKNNTQFTYQYNDMKEIDSLNMKSSQGDVSFQYVYDDKDGLLSEINYKKRDNLEPFMRLDIYAKTNKPVGFLEVDKEVVLVKNNRFKLSNVKLNPGLNKLNIHSISQTGKDKNYDVHYTYNPLGDKSFQYDKTGKLNFQSVKGDNNNFHYNDEGLISSITKAFGSKLKKYQYEYYSNNMLCNKIESIGETSSSLVKTQFLFDEKNNIVAEIIRTAPYGYKYIYMFTPDGQILFRNDRENSAKYYYHFDKDGSVIGMSDRLGEVACAYTYDAFGKVFFLKQKVDNPFLYLGHFFDTSSCFYFHKGISLREEEHSRFFNKSANINYTISPDDLLKKLFPVYFNQYKNRVTIDSLLKNLPIYSDVGVKTDNKKLLAQD